MAFVRFSTGLVVMLAALSPASAGRMTFDAEEIVGEVQKPEISVVITRENLNKAYEFEFEKRLTDKIIKSVDYAPF